MKKSIILTILILLLSTIPGWSQDTEVSATVGSDTVGIHDQVQLVIRVSGKDSNEAENPRFPEPQGFSVVSGPSIGTQFQWINGRSSSSKSFTYILVPKKEGQFTIDPIEVRVGDKTYETKAIQVQVTLASTNPSPQRRNSIVPWDPFSEDTEPVRQSIGDAVFMRAELDRESAYPGQQITLFYNLYTSIRVNGYQIQDNPPLTGFWVEDLETEKNLKGKIRTVNGKEYQVYTIKKQALFPNTTGSLKIPASTFAISVESGRDIFSIFDQAETIYRNTQELNLEVKPLPFQGRPDNFSDAVGEFKLSANIDKNEARTGEAIALEVKLEGRGNLKTIPDLTLPELPDFTIYSSKHEDKTEILENNQIGGEKTWEYVLVPKAPGEQTIPSVTFSFFNADQSRYETVSTQPLTLNVSGGNADAVSTPGLFDINRQGLTRLGTDIHFIKLSAGKLEKKGAPFYRKSWIYLVIFFPIILNASTLLYRRQQSRLTENAAAVRNRKARQIALKRLKTAERDGKSDTRRYYDLASSALSGYLADKFNLSEIELTGDNLKRTLSGKSVPRENIEGIQGCLEECDFGRFVSAAASAEKKAALSVRIRGNIDALEKVIADL
jgi:cell division protein FtsL